MVTRYTHFWYRPTQLDPERFHLAVADCRKVYKQVRSRVRLAGWDGEGQPKFGRDELCFNGVRYCGHPEVELPFDTVNDLLVDGRQCDGMCSSETFRILMDEDPDFQVIQADGTHFESCDTAYRPYDLMVCTCLVIFNHHFGDKEFPVYSDGTMRLWQAPVDLVKEVLGYGQDFRLTIERASEPKFPEDFQ